ncbi:hypothetical protein KJ765_01120 [Candidatus Micrarchaeota archaeon]|nr:hypothetical protein [Candidatus Micrarchaeota archaeon]
MRPLELLLLFAMVSVLFTHAYYDRPLIRDQLESFRSAEFLKEQQHFPIENANIQAPGTRYPPIFSVTLATLSALMGLSIPTMAELLAYATTVIMLLSMFLLARAITNSEKKALIATTVFLTMPWLFYRMTYPIAESMGFSLLLLAVYTFHQQRYYAASIVLFVLPLVHFRSAAIALGTLFLFALLAQRIGVYLQSALPSITLYVFLVPRQALELSNPWVIPATAFEMIGVFALTLGILGAGYQLLVKNSGLESLTSSFVLAFFVTTLVLPFPFRQLLFLSPAIAIFASEIVDAAPRVLPGLFIASAFILAYNVSYQSLPYRLEEQAGFQALQSMTGERVLAPFEYNYIIPWFSKKQVVAGPYVEELADGIQRIRELRGYYEGSNAGIQSEIESKYEPDFIVRRKPVDGFESIRSARVLDSKSFSVERR